MKKNISHKNFFLISFLPALAYWYLEENYPIKIAVIGGVSLALLEVLVEKIFTGHVHTLSKFNLYLLSGLGSVSLMANEGLWFRLQPSFTGIGISLFLLWRLWRGKGLLEEMSESMNKNPPPSFMIRFMEFHLSFLFGTYGLFMIFVAIKLSTDQWLFYKTIGFYIYFGFFLLFEVFYSRIKIKNWKKKNEPFSNIP